MFRTVSRVRDRRKWEPRWLISCAGCAQRRPYSPRLEERHTSGRAQYVDLSLLDSQVWLANQNLNLVTGPERLGTAHLNIAPPGVRHGDGHHARRTMQPGRFCQVAGPGTAVDPRFATNRARIAHRTELIARSPQLPKVYARCLARRLVMVQVPCGLINDLAQVFADPQVVHRGLRRSQTTFAAEIPGASVVPMVFSRTPLEAVSAPAVARADTDAVLVSVSVSTRRPSPSCAPSAPLLDAGRAAGWHRRQQWRDSPKTERMPRFRCA